MSIIGDTLDVFRELKELVQKKRDYELTEKLFELQEKIYELKEENERLESIKETEQNIERHSDWPYITLKNDDFKIPYCAICWGRDKKLIQTFEKMCPECKMKGEVYKQRVSYYSNKW